MVRCQRSSVFVASFLLLACVARAPAAPGEMAPRAESFDVVYMNGKFVAERRDAAKAMLKARFDALGWWHENTKEGNAILAEFLKWPVADVESVIGTNGKFLNGGIYMYDFNESAQVCGVLDGAPPFEIGNGSIKSVIKTVNEWWVRLGLMKKVHEPDAGVDCSLMGDLVAAGYSQSFGAKE